MKTHVIMALIFLAAAASVTFGQSLEISAADRVELLISDQQGRRTGFDPDMKKKLRDIPNSDYYSEGVGYIGEEKDVKTDNSNIIVVEGSDTFGPFLLKVLGVYSGKYYIWIARGIENRFVFDQERYIGRGMSEEFTLSFSPSNEGVLTKHVHSNSLKEDLQAIYAASDLGDEHFYNELLKDLGRFEGDYQDNDTLKAVRDLEKFQEKITKEHKKGIHQSPKRYIRPAAWKVLYDDAQSLIGQLIELPARPTGTLLEQLDSLKREIRHQQAEKNLGGVLLVKGLDLLVDQAKRSLQRQDSIKASQQLELFQSLVEEVNELTRLGWKKNRRHPSLFLNDEAYVELYYRAKYIIEALPVSKEERDEHPRQRMNREPELVPLGKELDSLKVKQE